jgi:hypothetical protein
VTTKSKKITTTELISWGSEVLPNGVIGAVGFATNEKNIYFLMQDQTVKSLIPEIEGDGYMPMPKLTSIVKIGAVGANGYALNKKGKLFVWGSCEECNAWSLPLKKGLELMATISEIESKETNDQAGLDDKEANSCPHCGGELREWGGLIQCWDCGYKPELKDESLAKLVKVFKRELKISVKGYKKDLKLSNSIPEPGYFSYKLNKDGTVQCSPAPAMSWYEIPEKLNNIVQIGYWGETVLALKRCEIDSKNITAKKVKPSGKKSVINSIPVVAWVKDRGKEVGYIKSIWELGGDDRFGILNESGKPSIISTSGLTGEDWPRVDRDSKLFFLNDLSPFWLPEGCVKFVGSQNHNLVLTNQGKVIAWGDNGGGQCTIPKDLEKIKDIQAGWHDGVERVFFDVTPVSLALTQKGQLTGWGCGGDASVGRVTKTMFKNAKTQKNKWLKSLVTVEANSLVSTNEWIIQDNDESVNHEEVLFDECIETGKKNVYALKLTRNNGNEIVVDVADYNKSLPVSWEQLLKKAKINYFAEKGIYDCVKMKSKEACEPVCIIVRS